MGGFGRSRTFWIFVALLLVTACVPAGCGLDEFGCGLFSSLTGKDTGHCYQWIAVQNADTDECQKVETETWAGTGQNPPKDKCYLMIAEKDGDPAPCDSIKGGMNSYTKDECYQGVGAKGGTADQCDALPAAAQLACRSGIVRGAVSEGASPDCGAGYLWQAGGLGGGSCVVDPDAPQEAATGTVPTTETGTKGTTEPVKTTAGTSGATPPESAEAATTPETKGPEETKEGTETTAGTKGEETATTADKTEKTPEEIVREDFAEADEHPEPTPQQEKGTRLSDALQGITDQGARSAIIQAFIKERERRDDMTMQEQQELLADIRDNYAFGQAMDEQANTLKANTIDKLTEKVDAIVEAQKEKARQGAWDWFKEKTYGWVAGRNPDNQKYVDAARMAEERYNQAVEKYNEALDSYSKGKDYFDRAKKAYDEVKQVMDNVRRLQDKVGAGKMTQGQADALKGGVLLGKGLEYATKYIPVFGETASEITAGTFQATMKFAEKRAERTTRLNACIDDPEHCDPNGISAY